MHVQHIAVRCMQFSLAFRMTVRGPIPDPVLLPPPAFPAKQASLQVLLDHEAEHPSRWAATAPISSAPIVVEKLEHLNHGAHTPTWAIQIAPSYQSRSLGQTMKQGRVAP